MEIGPKHIAIIMDGNGRWAKHQGQPRLFGHQKGSKVIKDLVYAASQKGVKHLTVFAFSCDNKARPSDEVNGLIHLFSECVKTYLEEMHEQGVRICFIGDLQKLDPGLYGCALNAKHKTQNNSGLVLTIAINFSGKWHILETTKRLLAQKAVPSDAAIQNAFQSLLPSNPDVLIRTGGERRLSDFVMYHLGYTELFFLDVKWPDFSKDDLYTVIDQYGKRERRFGALKDG